MNTVTFGIVMKRRPNGAPNIKSQLVPSTDVIKLSLKDWWISLKMENQKMVDVEKEAKYISNLAYSRERMVAIKSLCAKVRQEELKHIRELVEAARKLNDGRFHRPENTKEGGCRHCTLNKILAAYAQPEKEKS